MEKTQDDEAINKLWECFTSFVFFSNYSSKTYSYNAVIGYLTNSF